MGGYKFVTSLEGLKIRDLTQEFLDKGIVIYQSGDMSWSDCNSYSSIEDCFARSNYDYVYIISYQHYEYPCVEIYDRSGLIKFTIDYVFKYKFSLEWFLNNIGEKIIGNLIYYFRISEDPLQESTLGPGVCIIE